MAYSLSMYQAISIVVFIALKMKEARYEFLTTKHISEILCIARPTAVKILQSLNAAGLIVTKEGAKGGILLARPVEQITLYDIFEALEGGRPLFRMGMNFQPDQCGKEEVEDWMDGRIQLMVQRVDQSLNDAEEAMKKSLREKTIAQVIEDIWF